MLSNPVCLKSGQIANAQGLWYHYWRNCSWPFKTCFFCFPLKSSKLWNLAFYVGILKKFGKENHQNGCKCSSKCHFLRKPLFRAFIMAHFKVHWRLQNLTFIVKSSKPRLNKNLSIRGLVSHQFPALICVEGSFQEFVESKYALFVRDSKVQECFYQPCQRKSFLINLSRVLIRILYKTKSFMENPLFPIQSLCVFCILASKSA